MPPRIPPFGHTRHFLLLFVTLAGDVPIAWLVPTEAVGLALLVSCSRSNFPTQLQTDELLPVGSTRHRCPGVPTLPDWHTLSDGWADDRSSARTFEAETPLRQTRRANASPHNDTV